MRDVTFDTDTYTGKATFPDEMFFAFNPNYINVAFEDLSTIALVTVEVSSYAEEGETLESHSIQVSTYNDECSVYISRLVQLLFSNLPNERSVKVAMTVSVGDTMLATANGVALWGSLQIGERIGNIGFYPQGASGDWRRKVVLFTEYPFKVSVLSPSDSATMTLTTSHGVKRRETLSAAGITDVAVSAGDTINITLDENKEVVYVVGDNSKQGYYLRWIDRHGFLQYYLFVKGTVTDKTKLNSTELDAEREAGGMWFGNLTRVMAITNTITAKCSAVNLDKETLAYVETVVLSPYVDLYLGKNTDNEEIWLPVKVSAGSYKKSAIDILQDFEITLEFPDETSQTL